MTIDLAPPAAAPPPPPPARRPYPVRLEVVRPRRQSRITNFPLFVGYLIRAVMALPHIIILYFVRIAAAVVYFLATFAILFTGKYPLGMYNFYVGYSRWEYRVSGYSTHLFDRYPPFGFDPVEYPLTYEVDYPTRSSRFLNFPIFGPIIKTFFLLPHYFVLIGLAIIDSVVVFIAQFAILFTGSFPAGLHAYSVGVMRWGARVQAYSAGITDRYPPFSLL
jgi:hypothetical protein